MEKLVFSGNRLHHICRSVPIFLKYFFRQLLLRANPLWVHLSYFLCSSFLGFFILTALKPRTAGSYDPNNLDLFFTAVSAATVSSMSTVEMEVFSNAQLIVLTVLMLTGGEVFTSMIGLHFHKYKLKKAEEKKPNLNLDQDQDQDRVQIKIIELDDHDDQLKYCSVEFLCYVVLGYLLVVHVLGVTLISMYFVLVSNAKRVLESKGIKMLTFSVFTTISTFSNCGFVPTNENMIVFSKNSGLLLILVPQVLLGNTLFPSSLRFCIWVLRKFGAKKTETEYLMKKTERVGYLHLLSDRHSRWLVFTVLGFILVQMVLLCSMDWDNLAFKGLNVYQKMVGALFESVNSRHTGETIVDISVISRAVLVLFVVMMYLPPYTSFLPIKGGVGEEELEPQMCPKRRVKVVENLIFSQLSYLAIFVILICITERQKLNQDPLNFNVFNIVVEVISAYGNVGFTTGYSCARQLNPDGKCVDKWYGFSGKWSDQGKIILIVVMFFGRLKKFNLNGGKAWILL